MRTEQSDWFLTMYAMKQMLAYLHAAGHLTYAKSVHLHMQQMKELTDEVECNFVESCWVFFLAIYGQNL